MSRRTKVFNQINAGGIADSKYRGLEGSMYRLVGFDIHSEPGLVKVNQKMTKDSGAVVDELCHHVVTASNGINYWFSYESGKIWQEKNGTYTLVYTTSPSAGEAKCLGAIEYQGYIIWATENRLHRIALADSDGSANWTSNATANWQSFAIGDDKFHPMREANLVLYIGDGYQLAQVEGSTFSANALDLPSQYRISAIAQVPASTDIAIGTYIADNINDCSIFRWNTWGDSWYPEDTLPEPGIYAFLEADNYLLAFAGFSGSVYYYNGRQLEFYRRIPGEYSPTKRSVVHNSATAMFKGNLPLFAVSNVQGNPTLQGVYSLGSYSPSYNVVLNLEFPISEVDDDGYNVTESVEIGALVVKGTDVYMSYKQGANVGVDKLDYSNKIPQPYMETRLQGLDDRGRDKTFSGLKVSHASLPSGTQIVLKREVDHSGSFETLSQRGSTDDFTIIADKDDIDAFVYTVRIECVSSGNDAPEIEEISLSVK